MKKRSLPYAAFMRMLHTCAQTALGVIGAESLITNVDWKTVLCAVCLSAVVSLLKSVVIGTPESDEIGLNKENYNGD